jgi:hypothetical protein
MAEGELGVDWGDDDPGLDADVSLLEPESKRQKTGHTPQKLREQARQRLSLATRLRSYRRQSCRIGSKRHSMGLAVLRSTGASEFSNTCMFTQVLRTCWARQ